MEVRETTDILSTENLKDAIAKNNFVDLDQQLIGQIQEQVESVLLNQTHNEQTAKDAMEKWFSKILLKNRDFDVKMLRLTITNQPTIYIQSQYHCETRQFNRFYEPFNGQVIPDKAEELWEKEPQNQFVESDIKWRRFGNNEVKNCHNCSANGEVTCGDCNGKGEIWVTCGNCKGKGQIERTDAIIGKGGKQIAGGVVLRKEQCLRCSAKGKVLITCAKCNGGGKLTCGTCSGKKKLFYYDNIQGKSSVISKDLILSTFTTLKDKWIKYNKSEFSIHYKDYIQGQNENRIKDLIPVNGRLLLENYNVKVLPTAKVTFNFKGKDRELFIIDNEIFTNETTYLYDKKKTTIAISIGALTIVVLSFFGYQWFSSNESENIRKQNELAQNLSTETKTLIAQEKYSDAANKLAAFDISFADYEQSSKDSINSALNQLVTGILISEQLYEVEKLFTIYSVQPFIDKENKELLNITHSIVLVNRHLADLDTKRTQKTENSYYEKKKWEEISNTNIKIDNILTPILELEYLRDGINFDKVYEEMQKDFEAYLNFLITDGMSCAIDDELRKLSDYISKIKSLTFVKLVDKTKKQLEAAQIKYENPC